VRNQLLLASAMHPSFVTTRILVWPSRGHSLLKEVLKQLYETSEFWGGGGEYLPGGDFFLFVTACSDYKASIIMNIYDSPVLSPLTLIGLCQTSLLVSFRINIITQLADYSFAAVGTQRRTPKLVSRAPLIDNGI
jgi:hypothetical protein